MLTIALAAGLFAAQAVADEPPPLSATLDAAVKSIPGYRQTAEPFVVGDEIFLRRIMRDLVDAAPQAAEIQAFVSDTDPRKRTKRINQLLADPRFGDVWAKRFSKVFFGEPSQLQVAGKLELGPGIVESLIPAFEKYLAVRLNKDTPWTEIVSDLINARGSAKENPAIAYKLSFYRGLGMEQEFAEGVARHFVGIRLACTRCHDHPYNVWNEKHYKSLAAFAAGQRTELEAGVPILKYDDGATFQRYSPQFLWGNKPGAGEGYMQSLARFLTEPPTPQLAPALANRVWGWLYGGGLIEPVDDFNKMNVPIGGGALGAMSRDLKEGGYSLKRLVRTICNMQNYQLPTPDVAPDAESFRHLSHRRIGLGGFAERPKRGAQKLDIGLPDSWKCVTPMGSTFGARDLFRIPDPKAPARHAELRMYEGPKLPESLNVNLAQFVKPAVREELLAGKLKWKLKEVTGTFNCWAWSDRPLEYSILSAVVEPGSGLSYAFRLEGPADLVAFWREEFVGRIKSAAPK
jgi:hypothetical protein